MPWLISLSAAALAGIIGLVLAGFIANACVSWFSVSSREGQSGYFVIFNSLFGGVLAFIIGLIAARVVASYAGSDFLKECGAAVGAVVGIAGLLTVFFRFIADVEPTLDGRPLNLEVEYRFPVTATAEASPTSTGAWEFQLHSIVGGVRRGSQRGEVKTAEARREEGRWIVPCLVRIFTERGDRAIQLSKDGADLGGFLVSLPARPNKSFETWSVWFPRQQADGSPWPDDKFSYRFRIQKEPLPPPPKTIEEEQAEQAAEELAAFERIPVDAPVQSWFEYTRYEQNLTARAIERILQRPNVIAELRALAVGDDANLAHDTLKSIARMPEPPPALVPVVEAAAQVIASRITRFNETTVEADPDFATAVDPASRFYGWIDAAEALREKCQASFVPELTTILELSRKRPESHCMRQDICRLASYRLKRWAGIEPLDSDPKP